MTVACSDGGSSSHATQRLGRTCYIAAIQVLPKIAFVQDILKIS